MGCIAGCIDLREWIALLEREGELHRIAAKVDWDCEIGSTEYDDPAVWVTVYADESAIPLDDYGRRAGEMIPRFRSALRAAGIRRWPYIRLRTAREHMAG